MKNDAKTELRKVGECLSRRGYETSSLLGEGAFSKVFLVQRRESGEKFACKIGRRGGGLMREAGFLCRLRHPAFPGYVESWQWGDLEFLMMEYVPGENVRELQRAQGCFSAGQTASIAAQLAECLKFLHGQQPPILFRDVKPENIILCPDGAVRLVDFGCACTLEEQGTEKAGTPGFAAPEQLRQGGTAGFSSDVYGLGQTMRAMLGNGKALGIGRIIERCVRTEPGERLPDMESVLDSLYSLQVTGRPFRGIFREKLICEKNIWESAHKNSCSLPLI